MFFHYAFFLCFVFANEIVAIDNGKFRLSPAGNINATIIDILDDVTKVKCMHRCRLRDECLWSAFEQYGEGITGECFLLQKSDVKGRKFMLMHHNEENMEIYERIHSYLYDSCQDAYHHNEPSGIYFIRNKLGWHYCNMTISGDCSNRGWTLAMTVDGAKDTFEFSSNLWTNERTYNVENALIDPLRREAKFRAFTSMPFKFVCLAMESSSSNGAIKFDKASSSLLEIFQGGFSETKVEQWKWKLLLPGSTLQAMYNKEGFNVKETAVNIRLGITSNDEGGASKWTETWIGVGGEPMWCHANKILAAGNQCCSDQCGGGNGIIHQSNAHIYIS